jgi:hypothetical protein
MQIHWHGPKGKGSKEYPILTIGLAAALPIQHADDRHNIKFRPAQEGRELKLLPGINDSIAPSDWEAAKKTPLVKVFVDNGCLEVVDAEKLAKFTPPAAMALVKETIDMKLIEKWRKTEQRAEVLAAIGAHVADLTTKAPPAQPKK